MSEESAGWSCALSMSLFEMAHGYEKPGVDVLGALLETTAGWVMHLEAASGGTVVERAAFRQDAVARFAARLEAMDGKTHPQDMRIDAMLAERFPAKAGA